LGFEYRILGPLEASRDGQAIRLGGRMQRRLLAQSPQLTAAQVKQRILATVDRLVVLAGMTVSGGLTVPGGSGAGRVTVTLRGIATLVVRLEPASGAPLQRRSRVRLIRLRA
jgi:outer membrane receptor protein involved in Fe transport